MSAIHHHLSRPASHRGLALFAAAGLLGLGVVHLIDGPGSLRDTPYIGLLELALVSASVPLAAMLVVRPVPAIWRCAGVLTGLALGGYLASRTVGLPSSTDDIGNWLQPLGVVNLAVDLAVLAAVAGGLRSHRVKS